MKKLFYPVLLCLAAGAIIAAEEWRLPANEPKLKTAPGSDLVSANCLICHSADYISTQPPMNRAAWTATIKKMREKYGAPLPPDRVDAVVQYLVANYGKQ